MVIAWLLTAWFLMSSKNLQFYGITNALSDAVEHRSGEKVKVSEDPIDEYENHRQKEIRNEIEQLLENMHTVEDDFVVMQIEHRLKVLDSRLRQRFDEAKTIDALIADARATRNKNARDRMRFRNTNSGVTSYSRRQSSMNNFNY